MTELEAIRVARGRKSSPGPWVRGLLDPAPLAVSPVGTEEASLVRGLAFLVDARYADYQSHVDEFNWPPLGTWVGTDASAEARLLSAFGLLVTGSGDATNHLIDLADEKGAGEQVRTVARILASVALRDAGRPDVAVSLLGLATDEDPYCRALTFVHLGLAYHEAGSSEPALTASLAAIDGVPKRLRGTVIGEVLHAVGSRNAASFAFTAGRMDVVRKLSGAYPARLLHEVRSRAADGLSAFVVQEFDLRFQDPGQTTLSFRREDPVQTPLIAARMRAEVLGDWHLARQLRGELGKYQLLASLGVKDRQPAAALHLLRRADDGKALERAVRLYLSDGPLPPLREFAEALIVMPWAPFEVRSILLALAVASDVVRPEAANVGLRRVIAGLETLLVGLPHARLEDVVNEVVASLLPVSREVRGSDTDQLVAEAYRGVVAESNDPMILQSVGSVLSEIRWSEVAPATRGWWEGYCIQHLAAGGDRRFPATILARTLPRTSRIRIAATEAFISHPDLLTAINTLAFGEVAPPVVRRIAQLIRKDLRVMRESARDGRHGFGAFVNAPLALFDLLVEYPQQAGWRDLVSFIEDPVIPGSKKAPILDRLLVRRADVPQSVQRRIASWVARPVQYVTMPMETPDEIGGVVLRARLVYRAKPTESLTRDLAELAASPSRRARLEAALTLPYAANTLPPTVSAVYALSLSRDSAPEVRGAAARALALAGPRTGDSLRGLVWRRVCELLRDPGTAAAGWALGGLTDATKDGLPGDVVAEVQALSTDHASLRIRVAARQILTRRQDASTTSDAARPRPA